MKIVRRIKRNFLSLLHAFFFSGVLFILVSPFCVQAQTSKRLEGITDTVTGNQEQPSILYVVPWKQASDTTILYLPLDPRAMDDLFGHAEREEHQRQVLYIEELEALGYREQHKTSNKKQ